MCITPNAPQAIEIVYKIFGLSLLFVDNLSLRR